MLVTAQKRKRDKFLLNPHSKKVSGHCQVPGEADKGRGTSDMDPCPTFPVVVFGIKPP